jgi:hypothetical protein
MSRLVLILTLFFVNISVADEISQEELSAYLETIKEKEDEELLIASPQFEACKEKLENFRKNNTDEQKKQLESCVQQNLLGNDQTDEQIKQFADQLDLESYNKNAAKSTKSIRDYLQERLHRAIYGYDPKEEEKKLIKLKEKNLVNHDVFYRLYAEQIGKNTLLEVSKYCLENFGFRNNPNGFLYFKQGKYSILKGLITEKDPDENIHFAQKYELAPDQKIQSVLASLQPLPTSLLWSEQKDLISEYNVCTLPNDKQCKEQYPQDHYRSVKQNELLKDLEFKLAAQDPEKKLIKDRYGFCATQVIKNMCKIYKCNNTYSSSSPTKEKSECLDKFGIQVGQNTQTNSLSLESTENKGQLACNILARLEQYRTVLKEVKNIEEENQNFVAKSGYNADGQFKGIYSNAGGKADQLTSISSKELTEKVESFSKSEDEVKELKDKCLNGNELDGWELKEGAEKKAECKALLAKLNKTKFDTIEIDTEAKTAAKLQAIDKISSKEDLEKYLKENNLDQYIGRLDQLEVGELKQLISDDFKAKRMALIDNLKERFKKEKQIQVSENSNEATQLSNKEIKNDVANQAISDIEQHKNRVETLFEYSNIVSSYLQVTDNENNIVGSNKTGRQIELADNENLKAQGYFGGEESISSTGDSLDYIKAIEQIVGFEENDQNQKEEP